MVDTMELHTMTWPHELVCTGEGQSVANDDLYVALFVSGTSQ